MRALFKEAMAEIEVLPWRAASRCPSSNGVSVNQHLNGADVAGKACVAPAWTRVQKPTDGGTFESTVAGIGDSKPGLATTLPGMLIWVVILVNVLPG
jgi:hypothetical protein